MSIVRVYFEGDDDKAVLEGLDEAGLLPKGLELAKRDKSKHDGKDGLIGQLWPFVNPTAVGGRAIVLVDLDDHNIDQLTDWFRKQLEDKYGQPVQPVANGHTRLRHFTLAEGTRSGHAVLCPVGLPNDTALTATYKLERFAIDEYLLRLVLNDKVYAAVSEFKHLPHATAVAKLTEVRNLFHENGIDVSRSKTYMQIARAAAQIRPATATIAKRLVCKGAGALPVDEFRVIMNPLFDDLHAAMTMLTPIVPPG